MKKIIACILILLTLLTFTSCSHEEDKYFIGIWDDGYSTMLSVEENGKCHLYSGSTPWKDLDWHFNPNKKNDPNGKSCYAFQFTYGVSTFTAYIYTTDMNSLTIMQDAYNEPLWVMQKQA